MKKWEACIAYEHRICDCYRLAVFPDEMENKTARYGCGCLFIDCTLWCRERERKKEIARVCAASANVFYSVVLLTSRYMFLQILMTKQLKIKANYVRCGFEYHCNWIWSSWVSFFLFSFLRLHLAGRMCLCAVNKGFSIEHVVSYRHTIYLYFFTSLLSQTMLTLYFHLNIVFCKKNVNYFTDVGLGGSVKERKHLAWFRWENFSDLFFLI